MERLLQLGAMAIFAAVGSTVPILAAGYWNLPSSFCQCAGYGCGAGYHAPLVLGPVSTKGWLATNEIRLPRSPRPVYPSMGYPHYPLGTPAFDAPTLLEPAFAPPPSPSPVQPVPSPAAVIRKPLRY